MSGELEIVVYGEPYGACRWCGYVGGPGEMALLRMGGEWYECSHCCYVIGEHELYEDDADEIRRRSAELRAEEAS